MSAVKLSWAQAKVEDAKLTVALDGELPKDWKQSFERTVKLLGDGEWGPVALKKKTVEVTGVIPGSEEKLRHHLEAIVDQANAAHEHKEAAEAAEKRDDDGGEDADGDEPKGPDAEMTEQFRSFAGEADDEDSEGSEEDG